MSRRSKRDLWRDLEALADPDTAAGEEVLIQYDVVGSDGAVVDTVARTLTVDR